jgi:competence protein ComEA
MKNRQKLSAYLFGFLLFALCLAALSGCGEKEVLLFDQSAKEEADDGQQETAKPGADPVEELDPQKDGTTEQEPEEEASIFVDVRGEVQTPGVYELPAGSRVFQAVEAAGGVTEDAACEAVNQAKLLGDEEQIYIPSREELEQGSSVIVAAAGVSQASQEMESKININTADAAALMTLTGIGETRAAAILAYREEHGSFSSIEEIMNVQGIKEATFAKIKDEIVVG